MGLTIRGNRAGGSDDVHEMLAACGAFNAEEIRVALEMIDAAESEEYVLFGLESEDCLRGYACAGRAPLTRSSWYLYWICVHPDAQGRGIGRGLQQWVEQFVRESQGDRLVVETSGRPDYARTRRFYQRAGYEVVGRIADFYKPGDDCVIYCKLVGGAA